MSKITDRLSWIISNAIYWGTAYIGIVYHIQSAYNIFIFMLWVWVALTLLGIICTSDSVPKTKKQERFITHPFPVWITFTSDIVVACFLASAGHFFIAGVVVFQGLLSEGFYQVQEEQEEKRKAEVQEEN